VPKFYGVTASGSHSQAYLPEYYSNGLARDPFFAGEGDLEAARELVAEVGPGLAEVFVYDGDAHLFTDASLPSSDPVATALVLERSLELLARIG
jgi:hypothetical protein